MECFLVGVNKIASGATISALSANYCGEGKTNANRIGNYKRTVSCCDKRIGSLHFGMSYIYANAPNQKLTFLMRAFTSITL